MPYGTACPTVFTVGTLQLKVNEAGPKYLTYKVMCIALEGSGIFCLIQFSREWLYYCLLGT